jgi:hypothetical protein
MWGQIAGPLLAGLIADATGDYVTGFTVLAVLAGMGSGFFIFARRPAPPGSVAYTRERASANLTP